MSIWLSAIGFCLNQYKSLRRLETQVHYCVNRKDPLNIGDIKIVAREQDSIIWLDEFDNACKANKISKRRRFEIVPLYLKGIASSWWRAHRLGVTK